MTIQTQLVLQAMLKNPARETYGLELCEHTGLLAGTMYPILTRLEAAGWVTSREEQIDPSVEKRPRRRYWSMTADGAIEAAAALSGARRPTRSALRGLAGAEQRG